MAGALIEGRSLISFVTVILSFPGSADSFGSLNQNSRGTAKNPHSLAGKTS
jgi:hypothetical protein